MALAFIAGYDFDRSTRIQRQSNIAASISDAGTLRFVDMNAQTYHTISAVIMALTEASKETLLDWLITNETTEIDLTIGTETYTGYIKPNAPVTSSITKNTAHLWDVRFTFLGVKQ